MLVVAGMLALPGQLRVSAADFAPQVEAPVVDAGADSEAPQPISADSPEAADELCLAELLAWPPPAGSIAPPTWWLLPRLDSVAGSVAVRPPIA